MLKELIEYNGIDSFEYSDLKNFSQSNINDTISIPIEKPDLGQILKVWSRYNIKENIIINTPKGTSYDNQILTGYKTFLSGNLSFKLEYIANNSSSTIHSIDFELPFSSYVTLSSDYDECLSTFPSLYIEDVYCNPINAREVYINVTLISIVDTSN